MAELTEGFETNLGNFTSSGPNGWTRDSGGTPSGGTGPSSAYEGSYYVYVETSSSSSGDEDILTWTLQDTTTGVGIVSFAYHQYGSNQGTLELQYGNSTDGWTTVWSSTGDQGDQWFTETIKISGASVGDTIRFKNTAAGGFAGDISLDDITITEALPSTETISATLFDRDGNAQANLTAIKYKWYGESPLVSWGSPDKEGTLSSDSNGDISFTVDTFIGSTDKATLILESSNNTLRGFYSVPFNAGNLILDNQKTVSDELYFTNGVVASAGGGANIPVIFIIN